MRLSPLFRWRLLKHPRHVENKELKGTPSAESRRFSFMGLKHPQGQMEPPKLNVFGWCRTLPLRFPYQ
ncbi:unnamed protein product [Caretta caretta]